MNEDRGHERRRRVIGVRVDADRESGGKKPFTDREREAYIDRQLWLEQAEEDRKEARRQRCRTVWDQVTVGVVRGAILSFLLAGGTALIQWILAHYFHTGVIG